MLQRLALWLVATSVFGSAPHLYLAQSTQGSGSGLSCINALAGAFFNTPGNWGPAANQIGPGSTVHLCGTFDAPAGASGFFTFQGSGTAGAPISLVAEPGAILQAPWWGVNGAIYAALVNDVVTDGKGVGIIRATANGTKLANKQYLCGSEICTGGIHFERVDGGAIRNWTISKMYVSVAPDTTEVSYNSYSIWYDGGQNWEVCGNTADSSKWSIMIGVYPGVVNKNGTVCNNNLSDTDHGISLFTDNSGASGSFYYIYGNDIHDAANWDTPTDANGNTQKHHDGIHISPNQAGATITDVFTYRNHIWGNWGTGCNTLIYHSPGPGITLARSYIFDNVLENVDVFNTCANGMIQDYESQGSVIVNNTLVGPGDLNFDNAIVVGVSGGITAQNPYGNRPFIRNNILNGFTNGFGVSRGSNMPDSDYNVFFQLREPAYVWGTSVGDSMAQWRAGDGNPDTHSTFGVDPATAAPGKGLNLASLGIAALNIGRPATGPWDIGAKIGAAPPPPVTTISIMLNPGVSP